MQTYTLTDSTRVTVILPEVEETIQKTGLIVIRGSGKAVTKVVNLAEVLTRKIAHLHQINKICREENGDAGLEVRLSVEPLDVTDPGYQIKS